MWTRRFQRITLILDETATAQADLPGADSEFNFAQGPLVLIDIGGFPAGVSQPKGKLLFITTLTVNKPGDCFSKGQKFFGRKIPTVSLKRRGFSQRTSQCFDVFSPFWFRVRVDQNLFF